MSTKKKSLVLSAAGLLFSIAAGCTLFVSQEKLWGPAFGLAVAGDKAYLCAGAHLLVLDVANPRRPVKLGQADFSGLATDVSISGEKATVTVTGRGRLSVDISDPAEPREIGLEPPATAAAGPSLGVFIVPPLAYLNDTCEFIVLKEEAAAALRPSEAPAGDAVFGRAVFDPDCNVRGRGALFVRPPLAVAAFERHMYAFELGLLDVSDPVKPKILGSCPLGTGVHAVPRAIVAADGAVFIAASLAGLFIVDISNPGKPAVVGRFRTSTQIKAPPSS